MKLHLLGLPHTITAKRFSHCAFTGKVLRFAPMMRSIGYNVIHYGIEGSECDANENVNILSRDEWVSLGGKEPGTSQFGTLADTGSKLYAQFNDRLVPFLQARLDPSKDFVCLPFGRAHRQAMLKIPEAVLVETGIGYVHPFCDFRVYESYGWMNWQQGNNKLNYGNDYWWVIPNYFNEDEWSLGDGSGGYVAFLGRLNQDKGMDVIWEVAKHMPDMKFILCGQGDPTPYLTLPNIEYKPPIHGEGRDEYLGKAICTIMPTRYIEPFGGVTVESLLCGTPVVGSSYGSFVETIPTKLQGHRCRTLAEWMMAIEYCAKWNNKKARSVLREDTIKRYSMWNLAYEYDRVFSQLTDLRGKGWYTLPSERACLQSS